MRLRVLVGRGVLELCANDGLVPMTFAGKLDSDGVALKLEAGSDVCGIAPYVGEEIHLEGIV